MIKFNGKWYKPTILFRTISFTIIFFMAFVIDGCNTFIEMIVPILLIILFGYFALSGEIYE